MTGQQVGEQIDGPALQGLGQNGVVGVGTSTQADVPGLHTDNKPEEGKERDREGGETG